jgi:Fe2+ or Zn2+ uptake regulation protein
MGIQKVRKYICKKCNKTIETKQTDVDGSDLIVEQTMEFEVYWHSFCKAVTK